MGGAAFGKNKTAVLATWERKHGDRTLDEVTDDYLTTVVRNRRKGGKSGVTIAIDLTYIAGVFKTAVQL